MNSWPRAALRTLAAGVLCMGLGAHVSRVRADVLALGTQAAVASVSSRSLAGPRRTSKAAARARSLRERHASVRPLVDEAAHAFGLPVALLLAVIRMESDYNPRVVSEDGAMGLMQLMPATAASLGVLDPFDPRDNIFGGARFLRQLVARWNGNLRLVAASYNAGPGAVERYRGVPPFAETQRYVRGIERHYRSYSAGRILLRR